MITLAALTFALTVANPISIATCAVDPVVTQTSGDVSTSETIATQIHITFANAGSKPISSVSFAVDQDGITKTIVDRGTFSPGVATNQPASGGIYGL